MIAGTVKALTLHSKLCFAYTLPAVGAHLLMMLTMGDIFGCSGIYKND